MRLRAAPGRLSGALQKGGRCGSTPCRRGLACASLPNSWWMGTAPWEHLTTCGASEGQRRKRSAPVAMGSGTAWRRNGSDEQRLERGPMRECLPDMGRPPSLLGRVRAPPCRPAWPQGAPVAPPPSPVPPGTAPRRPCCTSPHLRQRVEGGHDGGEAVQRGAVHHVGLVQHHVVGHPALRGGHALDELVGIQTSTSLFRSQGQRTEAPG